MATSEQRVLIGSDDPSRVERLLAMLRRSNLSVRQVVGAAQAAEAARREPSDLIVVALPRAQAAQVLDAARGPKSVNQRAALLALVDRPQEQRGDERLRANRVLAADGSPAELEAAVAALLEVAPRADIQATVKLRRGIDEPYLEYEVRNLSASGMFVVGVESLPVGTVFGFELTLPGEGQTVLGRAQVVRHGEAQGGSTSGLGVSFLALGGEGVERLRAVVERRIGEMPPAVGAPPAPAPAGNGSALAGAQNLTGRREELEQLDSYLDPLLNRGLYQRLEVADWYVTGAELGLDSLRAFYGIVERVYSGTSSGREGELGIADLRTVHRALGELAKSDRAVDARVRIMLEIRRPLERLLVELSETRRLRDHGAGDVQHGGMVSRVASEVGRLIGTRHSLESHLREALLDLLRPRYIFFAQRARQRLAEQLHRQYGEYGPALGFEGPETLRSRRGQRKVLWSVDREIARIDSHLKAIHTAVYQGRFHPRASGDLRKDLAKEPLLEVVADVLVEGYEFLVRAYSAYRHALESVGADPGLLERSTRLASLLEADGGRRPGASTQARRGGERQAAPAPAHASGAYQPASASPR